MLKLNLNIPAMVNVVAALRTAVEQMRDQLRAFAAQSPDPGVAADARADADKLQALLDSTDFPLNAAAALAEAQTAVEKFQGPIVHRDSDEVG